MLTVYSLSKISIDLNLSVPTEFSGGCACGAVQYYCSAAPIRMVNCHCRDCQRAGGAGYSPTVIVSRNGFRIIKGDPAYYEKTADSGNIAKRAFCTICGSPLFASSSARSEYVGIRAASLNDPSWFKPTVDVWCKSAQPWDNLSDATEKHLCAPA